MARGAREFLRYVALPFDFIGIMRAYSGSLRGAGKTLTGAAIAIVMLGVVRFPFAWVVAGLIGETGIWLAFAVSNVAGATYLWYRRGTWRTGSLTEGSPDAPERTEQPEEGADSLPASRD